MRSRLAATLLAASLAGPALADAPPDRGFARNPVPSRVVSVERPSHRMVVRTHRPLAYRSRAVFVPGGPVYGPEPAYFPGMGGGSPNDGFGAFAPLPVAVTQYREAYIGRGLIYNVPPQPGFGGTDVISVRY